MLDMRSGMSLYVDVMCFCLKKYSPSICSFVSRHINKNVLIFYPAIIFSFYLQ